MDILLYIYQVKILRKLTHPNVVKIFHFFKEEPKYYYTVLQHLEGGELVDHIARKVQVSTSACYYRDHPPLTPCFFVIFVRCT